MSNILGLKDVFFLLTTLFILFSSLINYNKAILWFLIFNVIVLTIGLSHAMYYDRILFPIFIVIGIIANYQNITAYSRTYLFLFLYIIFISFANGQTLFDENSGGTYFFIIILIFHESIFKNPLNLLQIILLLWIICIAGTFNYILHSENVFSLVDVDPNIRGINIQNQIRGNEHYVDPNYFGANQAMGAIIAVCMLIYRKDILHMINGYVPGYLMKILQSNVILITIIFLLVIELWACLRGLSRGALVVLLSGLFAVFLLKKNYKVLIIGSIVVGLVVIGLFYIGIADLYLYRFVNDETGTSGRTQIWLAMYNSIINNGGIIKFFFGGGNDYNWWVYWTGNFWGDSKASSHNQFLTLWVNFGLTGLVLFIYPLIRGLINNFKNRCMINDIRIILFFAIAVYSLNLEPLLFSYFSWFYFAVIASYTPVETFDFDSENV